MIVYQRGSRQQVLGTSPYLLLLPGCEFAGLFLKRRSRLGNFKMIKHVGLDKRDFVCFSSQIQTSVEKTPVFSLTHVKTQEPDTNHAMGENSPLCIRRTYNAYAQTWRTYSGALYLRARIQCLIPKAKQRMRAALWSWKDLSSSTQVAVLHVVKHDRSANLLHIILSEVTAYAVKRETAQQAAFMEVRCRITGAPCRKSLPFAGRMRCPEKQAATHHNCAYLSCTGDRCFEQNRPDSYSAAEAGIEDATLRRSPLYCPPAE